MVKANALNLNSTTAGQVVQAQSSGIPTFSTATYPSVAGTSGKVLISDGTNIVSSTPTYPNASATSGKVIISDGTNFVASTPTFPNSASGTGTILRADGTNWVATTATYPATTTANQLLYSSATNVVGGLTSGNSLLAATDSTGTLAMRAFSVVIQTFTSNGTYTPTAGMQYCIIEVLGGGGAGGGGGAAAGGQYTSGSGGGAGEYARGVFSAATIGASKSVTIGAGGTGASGATGGAGGNTVVGSTIISANGGPGGVIGASGSATATASVLGGTGGTGGSIRTPGNGAQSGFGIVASGIMVNGFGGSSQYGAGGKPSQSATGGAGLGFGSGGGGTGDQGNNVARTGGAGAPGIVIVTEYVIA